MSTLNKLDTNVIERVAKLLEDEKSMSSRTGMQLMLELMMNIYESQNEIIEHIREQNGRVGKSESEISFLKANTPFLWMKANRLKSVFIFIGIFLVNSMINWADIRKPLIHAALKQFGVDIPLDQIP